MDETRHGDLRERMAEASSLPAGDPERAAIEARVLDQPGELRDAWYALLDEAAATREALADVRPPIGLVDRLLEAPDRAPRRGLLGWRRLAVAAALLVAAVLGAAVLNSMVLAPSETETRLARLTTAATHEHVFDRHVSVETGDVTALDTALGDGLPFAASCPDLGDAITLRGGRCCQLDGKPVAYSLWRGESGHCSVFQFRAADHGLPTDAAPTRSTVAIPDDHGRTRTHEVVVWIEDGRGFILVADDRRLLPARFANL